MIVDSAVYRNGRRVESALERTDLASLRASAGPGDFCWVGVHTPTAAELEQLQATFDLHSLAVEDVAHAHQRPRLDRYGEHLFLVLKTLWYVEAEDAVETGEINVFVGPDFVITVRHGEGAALATTRRALEGREQVLSHGPSAVVYAVCDEVVDQYEAVASAVEADVDEVETSVFSEAVTYDSARIYVLKRELAEMRRAVLPLRDPIHCFAAGSVSGIHSDAAPYFRDVSDHLARVAEQIDSLDDLLSTAFNAHIAQISMRQNDDMRKISAGAGLVLVPTLIAGIYGMNFHLTPSPNSVFGFWFALTLMALSVIGLFWYFRKSGWL
ncbi:MAG: magnesium and cobalt transport protein CorA [Nocardioides sp.]